MSPLEATPESGFMVPRNELAATNTVPSSITPYKVQQGPEPWWLWTFTTQERQGLTAMGAPS